MELKFNSNGIQNKVIPNIDNNKKYIKKAEQVLNSINAPSDEFRAKIRNCKSRLETLRENAKNTKTWMEDSIDKFEMAENNNSSVVRDGIDNIDIQFNGKSISTMSTQCNELKDLTSNLFKDKNSTFEQKIQETILQNYLAGSINTENMSKDQLEDEIIKIILKQSTLDEAYEFFYAQSGKYGIGQEEQLQELYYYMYKDENGEVHTIKASNIKKIQAAQNAGYKLTQLPSSSKRSEYKNLLETIQERYNMSAVDATKLMSVLKGTCTYAATANCIFGEFKDNPELFEKTFGFPMYKKENGTWKINDKELLIDLYVSLNSNYGFHKEGNSKKSVDGLFVIGKDGKLTFKEDRIETNGKTVISDDYDIAYFTNTYGLVEKYTDAYIKSKSGDFDSEITLIHKNEKESLSDKKMQYVINQVKKATEAGKQVCLSLRPTNNNEAIKLWHVDENSNAIGNPVVNPDMSHAVAITDMTEDGFIISSWGRQYLVKYEDLQQEGTFVVSTLDLKI